MVDAFVLHDNKLTVSFLYSKEGEMLCFLVCYCEPHVYIQCFCLAVRHTF